MSSGKNMNSHDECPKYFGKTLVLSCIACLIETRFGGTHNSNLLILRNNTPTSEIIAHALHEAGNLVYAKILLWIDYHDHVMAIIDCLKLDIPHRLLRHKEDKNIALTVANDKRLKQKDV